LFYVPLAVAVVHRAGISNGAWDGASDWHECQQPSGFGSVWV